MTDYGENIKRILHKIEKAAYKSGRNPQDITLLAVGKVFSADIIQQVYDLGQRSFGESRAQELRDKVPQLPEDIDWHFIGPLQTNKIKYVVPNVNLIHAVDSVKLAKAIAEYAGKHNIVPSVLAEINTSGEDVKKGFDTDEAVEKVLEISEIEGLQLKGLMTMAPYTDEKQIIRHSFSTLKRKFDEISKNLDNPRFKILSMGMSGDFEIAIEEGSTLVRVGTGIFGPRRR